jgi:hypothetical protein
MPISPFSKQNPWIPTLKSPVVGGDFQLPAVVSVYAMGLVMDLVFVFTT